MLLLLGFKFPQCKQESVCTFSMSPESRASALESLFWNKNRSRGQKITPITSVEMSIGLDMNWTVSAL